ncbi:unnamed protein product [Spirodela intermedia]|uniref:Uncharacterized protein n=1 Tax=Spirodela intermedia TaxID=51605 RepID=A0A7I8J2N5_SPIIN|nr:unnamed protein product [Spirodela intermedia]CAA6664319.1 unnamed protein product [Spirodela intermedia]
MRKNGGRNQNNRTSARNKIQHPPFYRLTSLWRNLPG